MRSPDVDLFQPAGRLTKLKLDLNLLLSEQNGLLDFFPPQKRKSCYTCVCVFTKHILGQQQKSWKRTRTEMNQTEESDTLVTLSTIVEGSLVLVQAAYEPGITTITK